MDTREAKEILTRYRPGETATDPLMGEALDLARRDPQLGAWLAKQHAAQSAAAAQAGPDADRPAQPAPAIPGEDHIIPRTRPVFIMAAAAAAVLLILLLLSLNGSRQKDVFVSYRNRMARLVQRAYPMTKIVTDQSQIREYFRTNGGPADFTLPHNLEKLPGKGAAVFTWHSHPVALLGLDGGANTNLYLFLINRSVFVDTPVPTRTEFARVGKLLTASWTTNDRVYVLTGPDDPVVMSNFVESSAK